MKTGKELIQDIDSYKPDADHCAFWWLGQHSFVLKSREGVCYLDPFLTPIQGRQAAPPLAPSDIANATLILGSHDHADHIDRDAWPMLAKASPQAKFVVPDLLRARVAGELNLPLERVAGVDQFINFEHSGIKITGVPAAHEFLDADPNTGLHPYLGFVLELSGLTVYHAGDTCMYEGMQEILRFWNLDLAFLPINGRDAKRLRSNCIGNMTYQEAADLAGAIQPRLTVPAHFDMFQGNMENPALFADYMAVKYPDIKVCVPQYGQRTIV